MPDTVVTSLLPLAIVTGYLVIAAAALIVRNLVRGRFVDEEIAARGESAILPRSARMFFAWALMPLWGFVRWTGIPPNAITTLATLLSIGSGAAVAVGQFALGGWLFLLAGVCDVLDGRLARHTNTAGPSGAVVDSVLDRYSDAAVLAGLAWYFRNEWMLLVVLAALTGSLLVSYVRARGEGLGVSVKVGLMQRPERVVLIGASLALGPFVEVATAGWISARGTVMAAVCFVAIGTQMTAATRFVHILRALRREPTAPGSGFRRVIPAVVSAGLATAADFGVVVLLVSRFDFAIGYATALGCVVGAIVNFLMNRWWTFGSHARPAPQAVRYAIVSVTSALLNSGGVALFVLLPIDDYVAWLVVRGAVFLFWNFPLQRDYVYGRKFESKPDLTVEDSASAAMSRMAG